MPVQYKDVEFESGCFAYARVPGHPLWPCVIYNHPHEVPPELLGKVKLQPKEGQMMAYFIEHWTWSLVQKIHVKAVSDVDEAEAVKGAKSSSQKKQLLYAIESMKQMQLQQGEDIAVVRPQAQPPQAPPAPGPLAASAASAAPAQRGTPAADVCLALVPLQVRRVALTMCGRPSSCWGCSG